MTSRKLASAAAAASLAGAAVLGMAAPAAAQTASCYPNCTAAINDRTLAPGQSAQVTSGNGTFNPGMSVAVTVPGTSISGTVTADAQGNATFNFTVPAGTRPGNFDVVFTAGTNVRRVSFTVVAAAAAQGQATSAGARSLPRTGADQMVPLAISGIALVGIGAGIVVASRRRREDMPAGIA